MNRTIATLVKAMHGTDQKRRAAAARKLAMLTGAGPRTADRASPRQPTG